MVEIKPESDTATGVTACIRIPQAEAARRRREEAETQAQEQALRARQRVRGPCPFARAPATSKPQLACG